MHQQPTIGTVPSNFNAGFHPGYAPRVSIPQQQQAPPTQPQQSVSNAPSQTQLLGSEYIPSAIRDSNARMQTHQRSQQQQQQPTQVQQQQQQQSSDPSGQSTGGQPAYKKLRLGEPFQQQQNSLFHPANSNATAMPIRGDRSGGASIQQQQQQQQQQPPNNPVVFQVDKRPAQQTVEIQYQQHDPTRGGAANVDAARQQQQQQQQQQSQAPKPQQSHHVPPTAPASSAAAQTQQQQQQQQAPQSVVPTKVPIGSVLKIDTREPPSGTGGYHPQTEAISPPSNDIKYSKDDLLAQISDVDSNLKALEERKIFLKEKGRRLMEQKTNGSTADVPELPAVRHRTLAQQIYAENKRIAAETHTKLNTYNFKGQVAELPLYNQPSDAEICRKIQEQYVLFRSSLVLHLRKIKSERAQRNQELADKYAKLSAEWQKRVEKLEASVKRKTRDARNREIFEKFFPELRKQREDKERFNRVGSRVKSEADFEEIVDGLQEQV